VNDAGELVVETDWNTVTEARPFVYQEDGSNPREVAASYRLISATAFGFDLKGPVDPDRPLIIDPVLTYCTYLGAGEDEQAHGIVVDSLGAAYLVGRTESADFPMVDALDSTFLGSWDAFVAKLNSEGTELEFSTYLGGAGTDAAWDVTMDDSGNIYLTGSTTAADFPLVNPFQSEKLGYTDAFVAKLNGDGSMLLYSTYFGGSSEDAAVGLGVDDQGQMYLAGFTYSTDFPLVNPYQSTTIDTMDAFVAKLTSQGDGLVYSTLLGGNKHESATAIAVNGDGEAYVTGHTCSHDFPTVDAIQSEYGGGDGLYCGDAFVTKFTSLGDVLFSTYVGGNGQDEAFDIALDGTDNAHIIGSTRSTNFPTINAFDTSFHEKKDVFVTKLSSQGDQFIYSTYLGGDHHDYGRRITVDQYGNAYVTGMTKSSDFPLVNPLDTYDFEEVFVTKFDVDGASLVYSTYLGGSGWDEGLGLAVDRSGQAYIAGSTFSADLPVVQPYDSVHSGYSDAFVARITPNCVDADGDGFGDPDDPTSECPDDNCPSTYNPSQVDHDTDGLGDACDNCPMVANTDQTDSDENGIGDVCECQGIRGNIDGDPGDQIDVSDLVYLVDYMFSGGPPPVLPEEGDIDGVGGLQLDISDLVYLVDYMFTGGPEPVACL
jgi:hypothetical protein